MAHVSEVMTRDVRTLAPHDTIAIAARTMDELDVGVVPVCEGDRLVGLVTDRDIVLRAVAQRRPADTTPLEAVMTSDPRACFDDEPVDAVLERMRDARVRRMPVIDREHHLVGMLSLGDVAVKTDGDGAAIVLQEVSTPVGVPDDIPPPRARRRDAPPIDADPEARVRWVLVADEAVARFLEWPGPGQDLENRETLTDPAAHAKESDLRRDEYGRRAASATQGSRHNTPEHRLRGGTASVTSSAGEDQQHLEAEQFARRVAKHLTKALQQKRYDELHIVAAPRFLGRLRQELDAHVRATVVEELDKDLVHSDNAELTQRLFGARGAGAR